MMPVRQTIAYINRAGRVGLALTVLAHYNRDLFIYGIKRMWFKNLIIYRLKHGLKDIAELEQKLAQQALTGCGKMDMQCSGWVPPKPDYDNLIHKAGQQLLLCLGTEKKLLPASVINQFTAERAADIEEQQGYKPGRKQMKEIKEAVTDELLPRAFCVRQKTFAWLDLESGWLTIDAGSLNKADALLETLFKTVDNLSIQPLRTQTAAAGVMTTWLADENSVPDIMTIERDCELTEQNEEKATVRYVRHSLDTEDIQRHINEGKTVTKLALTWRDKISFVLQENLQLKKVSPLDVLTEQTDGSDADELFDAEFVMMCGELRQLLQDLTDILGGEASDNSLSG